ncbi:cell division protein FtsQ/DivIB [Macrococcus armenti]|uniref:cell division protein FtsQ/DivIB n=1 Tax=Macrococcus armenti TaxID=2875764 RepID=UPI001CCCB24D|nr:FtsQ-type POTRA domain-containing protein [Macrococcus armenti]UBH13955.1 FtsQ-type POTRA domain-containing protein [Macrococcus armenti]UBH23187.1 FtsQ-type POTRA domain-containing protein [Macrococcus armenti]
MDDKIIHAPKFDTARRKRRKRRQRIQLTIFLAIVAIVALILFYMFSNISYVKSISVNDTTINSSKSIKEQSGITKNMRIYSLDKNQIVSRIEYLDGVKSVTVHRYFPNIVAIEVEEYKVLGVVKDDDSYHPVLENGQILHKVKFDRPSDVPVLNNFSSKALNQLVKVLSTSKEEIINQISEVNFIPKEEATNRVQFYMKNGLEVIGDMRTIDDKLNYFPGMASKLKKDSQGRILKPGIIDLEVGAVFIPYESKKAEARRLELEKEMEKNSEKDKAELEKSVEKLKKELNQIKSEQ